MTIGEDFSVLEVSRADAKRINQVFKNTRECYYVVQHFNHLKAFVKIFHRDAETRKEKVAEVAQYLQRAQQAQERPEHNGVKTNGFLQEPNESESMEITLELPVNEAPSRLIQVSAEEVVATSNDIPPERTGSSSEHLKEAEDVENRQRNVGRAEHVAEELREVPEESGGSSEFAGDGEALEVTGKGSRRRTSVKKRSATPNAFNCGTQLHNIERPPIDFKELLLLRPYAAHFMKREDVRRGTALQNAVWPDLFAGKSMAILGPRGYGKIFTYVPLALTTCLRNVAIILTVTDQRLADLVKLISYQLFSVDVSRPPSTIVNARKQILVCSLGWFWEHRRDLTPSVIVFDKLDLMIDFSLDVLCVEVAESFPDTQKIATARKLSTQLEHTLQLMQIHSSAMVPTERHVRRFKEYLVSIDDSPERSRMNRLQERINLRFAVLLSTLKKLSLEHVVLIFFRDENEVHEMYEKLDQESNRSAVPITTFNNLHEKYEEEKLLLRKHLHEGLPGVYLACLLDHTWLYTTNSVHTVINYRPPDSAQAYRYRRERLRPDGKVLTILRGSDLNLFPEELFYLMSDLSGDEAINPCVDELLAAFIRESELRSTLRYVLLS